MSEAYKALTQAPVDVISHSKDLDKEALWVRLKEASEQGFPMGASTGANKLGLPPAHAYAVFEAMDLPGIGSALRLYNPWSADRYSGKIPNKNKADGLFNITFEEYLDAFVSTTIAAVRSD